VLNDFLGPAVVVGEMIERTMYAASSDETRYKLNDGADRARSRPEVCLQTATQAN
jgi:hypothetical protein